MNTSSRECQHYRSINAYVIVYMLNRFARNRYEDAIVGLTLERLGVTAISAKEHIHGNDPSQRMMRGMLAVFNQYQSEASSADIKEKLAHKARHGGTIGYAPIGYLNVREEYEGRKVNTVTVDPDRGSYITHIAELYASGRYSYADIRQIVTEQGLRTRPTNKHPAGTPISINSIGKILSDRYYCGYVTHNGIERPGRHIPLISEELYQRVQKVLAATGHSGIRRRVHHPLKGLLWCLHCKNASSCPKTPETAAPCRWSSSAWRCFMRALPQGARAWWAGLGVVGAHTA